ncbi:MAG: T9SS type A sorting domain-containing protein [bacterium]|nr:T9SS type A sorting domain-containing protein [bacterium]
MKRIFLLFLVMLSVVLVQAQQLLTENFDYTKGQILSVNTWNLNGAVSVNPILVDSPGLSYSGYVLSNLGNAAYLKSSGLDYYKQVLTTTNSGAVYASMMIRPDSAKIGDYVFGLFTSSNVTNYFARVYIKAAGTGYYRVGVSKATDGPVYATDSFLIGTVSMVVVKYQFATGSNTNDSVSMFQFTSGFPAGEPTTPTALARGNGVNDMTNVGYLGLRQGNALNAPSIMFDGLRVGNTWADLNGSTSTLPGKLGFVFVNNITAYTARINFTKPINYSNNLHSILIFLKKGTSIAAGNPVKSASYYLADSNFAGTGTAYEYDTAKCVYNGDGTIVNVVGLQPLTRYIAMGFCISIGDSLYSDSTISTSFITTSTAPGNSFGFSFTATSTSSIRLSWIKNTANYNNTNHTSIVFLKELSAISTGVNTQSPNLYLPDTNYTQYSSPYQYDALAKCVYNGDSNYVNVSGLKAGTRYYAYLVGANVFDTVYSNSNLTNGYTLSNGPAQVSFFRFTGRLENNSTVSWTKSAVYDNATHTVLVFMRKDTFNFIYPAPINSPNTYTADSAFGAGTGFEGDPLAKCIYNGDGNSVMVSNLVINSRYYLVAYVARTDSGYFSLPNLINGRTMVDTTANLLAVGANSSSVNFSWTKPANYVSGTFTTLVFVKANTAIVTGSPNRNPNRYTANANFGSGTKFQNDIDASCVFRGTGTSVTINNLVYGTNYYITVYSVRVTDSVYSKPNSTIGKTLDAPLVYNIAPLVKTDPSTGVVDSSGKRAMVRGVVYGGNNLATGLQFVIRDATGGITVYSTPKTFSYTPKEGDSIEVTGKISQYFGLSVITTLDTIKLLGSGKNIAAAKKSNFLNEGTENDLVIFDRLTLITPITNWPTTNVLLYAKNSYTGDTIPIRIYNPMTGIGGKPAPSGEFSMKGMGGQATPNNTAPFPFTGYRLVPRRLSDISLNTGDSITDFSLLTPVYFAPIDLTLDSNTQLTFSCSKVNIVRGVGVVNYALLIDESNGDFSVPLGMGVSGNTGIDTTGSISYGQISSMVPWLSIGDSVYLKVRMVASFNTQTKLSVQENIITVFKTKTTGLNIANALVSVNVFPNPVNGLLNVQANSKIVNLKLNDLQGKELIKMSHSNVLNLEELPSGIYILTIETQDGIAIRRIQVNH